MLNLTKLNVEQLQAVTATMGPILVVAGAGTGKTRVLTQRIAYLIDEVGFSPNRILAITFTNKAANEMKTRVANMLNNVYVNWIGTYHSICLRILKEDINFIGRKNDFTVIDDEDQMAIIRDIIKEENISIKTIKPKKALSTISDLKMTDTDLSIIDSIWKAREFEIYDIDQLNAMKIIYKKYNDKLLSSNSLDFDDLLLLTYKLLHEAPNVREKWQNNFDYVLVDEFQDTNKIQFDILQYLINPNNKNIFIVGDPDQTIYTWRGAYPDIFKDFLSEYKETKKFILDINYRSTKHILDAANSLISFNTNRIKKDLTTTNQDGIKPIFFKGETHWQEANFVAKKIKDLINSKEYDYKDIYILYRAKFLSRSIEQELIKNSIPYYVFGTVKFYQRREIKDLVAYLKLLVNKCDELAIKRVINVPSRKVGEATITSIAEYAMNNNNSFGITLFNNTWKSNGVNEFVQLVNKLINECKNKNLFDTVQHIIKETKYEDHIRTLDLVEERLENINEFVESIKEYQEKNPNATLADFLSEISIYTSEEDNKSNKNTISLMTIHYAKGTEAKVVFIIGMSDGIFPSIKLNQENDIQEERRIAYVAVTRAMEKLFLTCNVGFSAMFQSSSPQSRFIKEIGNKNLQVEETKFVSISKASLEWYDSHSDVNYADNYTDENVEFSVGNVVVHTIFGSGVIVGINGDMLNISFKAPFGIKTIVKNHKSLKRMKS